MITLSLFCDKCKKCFETIPLDSSKEDIKDLIKDLNQNSIKKGWLCFSDGKSYFCPDCQKIEQGLAPNIIKQSCFHEKLDKPFSGKGFIPLIDETGKRRQCCDCKLFERNSYDASGICLHPEFSEPKPVLCYWRCSFFERK